MPVNEYCFGKQLALGDTSPPWGDWRVQNTHHASCRHCLVNQILIQSNHNVALESKYFLTLFYTSSI